MENKKLPTVKVYGSSIAIILSKKASPGDGIHACGVKGDGGGIKF